MTAVAEKLPGLLPVPGCEGYDGPPLGLAASLPPVARTRVGASHPPGRRWCVWEGPGGAVGQAIRA
jgi:hypothetical protein